MDKRNSTAKNNVSFDDTAIAFASKSTADLKMAKFLFSLLRFSWLVKIGTIIIPLALKFHLPVKGILKKTIFKQFIGGETLAETKPVIAQLHQYRVNTILDYGAEGKEHEESFDHVCQEFIRLIKYAASQKSIPFISIKITGLARFGLLEKLNEIIIRHQPDLNDLTRFLSETEQEEWQKVLYRVNEIAATATEQQIGVLIDAEETWIQHTIDLIAFEMMKERNREKAVIYNTIQFYRKDSVKMLRQSIGLAKKEAYILGLKIVRGAYMEKERARATASNYDSPIHESKEITDHFFNDGMKICLENSEYLSLIIASHNEYSNLLATELLAKNKVLPIHAVHFSQLYGMSDHLTFNLAKHGFEVSKYLPYGPINDVIPYLMRRAEENKSVAGQTGRELFLIKKEIKRREKQ